MKNYKSYQELKCEALDWEECKQFPVKFADGQTIFIQPEIITNGGAFKKPNTLDYLKKHHPERVKEYQQYLDKHNQSMANLDRAVYGSNRPHWGTGEMPML